ncbi:hypothetical protein [Calderihabitans maritimus]|uniref:Uncharacterized protein n=1 Tax=Calderihabitans maritimus TaxID=1246530 RepID=A0A1Z5HUV0_9FIRM|nr:hypothetical protein [Calderihabitans maritimus]GAW93111.1 hypothetical protein KKC1_22520 [Calderihabitans maritimus]
MKEEFRSCFQCVAFKVCNEIDGENTDRQEARRKAIECQKFYKGRTTDLVTVLGRDKKMSRKKAFKFSLQGRLKWIDRNTVQFK